MSDYYGSGDNELNSIFGERNREYALEMERDQARQLAAQLQDRLAHILQHTPVQKPELTIERRSGMNYTTAVMLINENIRAVKCSYNPEEGKGGKHYTFKTLDQDIRKDDLVIVPTDTRHGFTVCKVEEVDVEVDYDSDIQLKWIAQKLNLPAYNDIVSMEADAISVIKKGEIRKRKEEIKKNSLDAIHADLDSMAIAHAGSDPALIEQPRVPGQQLGNRD